VSWLIGILAGIISGIISGILASLLLQNIPVPVKWSDQITVISGNRGEGTVHRARLSRRRWSHVFNARGPVDLQLHASMSVRINDKLERNIPIPLDKEWRPGIKSSIPVLLNPQQCRAEDLRKLPEEIRHIHREGDLTLEALFKVGRPSDNSDKQSELRLYAYGIRRRTGTRFLCAHAYTREEIKESTRSTTAMDER
jgi:hypothetical protein